MDVTLEQVLVAARERRAPVTPETAGYIALAIADGLVAAPAQVRESDVRVHDDGTVVVVGAQRAADGQASERSVRILLGRLMQVAAGSAPALASSARSHGGGGIEALVAELEAALVPVNRSAAKRAIARLAREASRAAGSPAKPPQGAQVASRDPAPKPKRASARPAAPPARPTPPVERPAPPPASGDDRADVLEAASEPEATHPLAAAAPAAPEPEAAAPAAAKTPGEQSVVSNAATETPAPVAAPEPDPTEVDAPVAAKPQLTPPPPTPEPPAGQVAAAEKLGMTPRLATYDPNAARAAPPPVVAVLSPAEPSEPVPVPAPDVHAGPVDDASRPLIMAAPAFGEVVEADIPTPSIAIDVESGAGLPGDGSPSAEVVEVPSLDVPPIDAPKQAGDEAQADASEGEGAQLVQEEVEPEQVQEPEAVQPGSDAVAPQGDRVGELLASFGKPPERSSKDLSGDIKQMLGLPLTPPPPEAEEPGHETPGTAATRLVGSDDDPGDGRLSPVEFARPRAPRSSFRAVVVLLVLALGALAAVWYYYPQVFVGH